jgi:hypothetical protein
MATTANMPVVSPRYDLADVCIAAISGLFLAIMALSMVVVPFAGKLVGYRDFVAYYATGVQLVHRLDPYDPEALRAIEHASGLSVKGVLVMRNPPWSLPLAYPLGFVGVRIAYVIWSGMVLACILITARLMHKLHGSPPNPIHWLAFSFTPALMCLNMGQTSLFVLLGVSLFLYYHRTNPFGAGAALWLCTLKPHLLIPFAVAGIAWIVYTRAYKIVAGAAAAMAASCAVTLVIDPSAFTRYSALMKSPAVVQEYVPCLSDTLRFWLRPQAVWIQYTPVMIASVIALVYYWRRRANWDWMENGSPLIVLSLFAAPYVYIYDQCVAIPAILHGAYTTRFRPMLIVLVGALGLIAFQATQIRVTSGWYMWVPPFWLAWYLAAHRSPPAAEEPIMAPAAARS